MTSQLKGVDLVIPFFNEERDLPPLLNNLATQVDADGEPLRRGFWRLILVDNGSQDRSADIVQTWINENPSVETVVLHEPIKSHIQGRICGASFSLDKENSSYAILANADADTLFHPGWIYDISKRLNAGNFDVLSYAGHFPPSFWERVPAMTQSYFENVGTIFFGPQTIEQFGFAGRRALFTEKIFLDFGRMPSDCGYALTKRAYTAAGGYRRDYWPDGREVLGEGWNLKFRLDAIGARIAYVSDKPYQTSPRRLLLEAEDLLSGKSYAGEMSDLRDEPRESQFQILNDNALSYDFDSLRRYVVKNYILLQCITRPELIKKNYKYFDGVGDNLLHDVTVAGLKIMEESSANVYELAETLLNRYYDVVFINVSQIQTLV